MAEAARGAEAIGQFLMRAPDLTRRAEASLSHVSDMAEAGVRLDEDTVTRLANARARKNRVGVWAIWIAAVSLAAIALRNLGVL